jgi:UDP-N-acetylmuramate dehydrogenase
MKEFSGIRKNVPLAPYTTFKIGGKAKYFYEAKSKEDLVKAIKAAKEAGLPFFILGGGSNVLVSDKGFDGLVIKIQNTKYEIQDTRIVADAGVLLSKLVDESVKVGLTGLEWAAGIPGTVGGAVRGNANAFGVSMSDVVKNIRNYEDIILSVELELKKGDREKSKKMIKEYLEYRDKRHPLEYPSAGCIFKNPEGDFAGRLIEQCGLKGKKEGGAMFSKKHGNFIVNLGNAKAKDVIKLINLCKKKVREKFRIELEEEIEYLGEF